MDQRCEDNHDLTIDRLSAERPPRAACIGLNGQIMLRRKSGDSSVENRLRRLARSFPSIGLMNLDNMIDAKYLEIERQSGDRHRARSQSPFCRSRSSDNAAGGLRRFVTKYICAKGAAQQAIGRPLWLRAPQPTVQLAESIWQTTAEVRLPRRPSRVFVRNSSYSAGGAIVIASRG